jgi:hypothetical protein
MFDIDKFRYVPKCEVPQELEKPTQTMIKGQFLKGPIPIDWLSQAAKLPGKSALLVGIAIWFHSGRTKSKTVVLTSKTMQNFARDRRVKYEGLKLLEEKKLIKVCRRNSKNPEVTILSI